jgi:hypothetical protein
MRYQLALTVLVAALSGCATDVANRYYLAEKYPERSPSEVALLSRKPPQDFIVMADFQSRGESPEDMRTKAAKIGADAVIVSTLGGFNSGEQWADEERKLKGYTRIVGTAIKFK